jgi:predicted alpha/beta hydrolase family esterase
LIIHGYGATPADHWFGWLAAELDRRGTVTSIPALPSPDQPDPGEWLNTVSAALDPVDEGVAVVAHSLGCLATLRGLGGLSGDWRLGTLVLVAGFLQPLPALPELDVFIDSGGDVTGLADHIDRLVVLRSDDDPYVPVEHTDRLATLLGVRPQIVSGAGHFMASDGVTALTEVLSVFSQEPGGSAMTSTLAS